ncbi:MAG: hypothetical protein WC942_01760 [Clostridia bacterium]|jgi:hypothetical protein
MLSIITTGRNDNYGGNFLERMRVATEETIKNFQTVEVVLDYHIIEWNPIKEPLCQLEDFQWIFSHPYVHETLVDASLVRAEKLPENIYFEYFAKNVGLRRCKYSNILILNSDTFVTAKLAAEISALIANGLDHQKFYRARYREQVIINDNDRRYMGCQDLHKPYASDAIVCGTYSGDFLLCTQRCMVEYGRGYNEESANHRKTFQTGMDGEILWNMHNHGAHLEFCNQPYVHIYHGKDRTYDHYEGNITYNNKPHWGFTQYACTKINDSCQKLYAIEDEL